jgi:hypothetical protein
MRIRVQITAKKAEKSPHTELFCGAFLTCFWGRSVGGSE